VGETMARSRTDAMNWLLEILSRVMSAHETERTGMVGMPLLRVDKTLAFALKSCSKFAQLFVLFGDQCVPSRHKLGLDSITNRLQINKNKTIGSVGFHRAVCGNPYLKLTSLGIASLSKYALGLIMAQLRTKLIMLHAQTNPNQTQGEKQRSQNGGMRTN
jgi:hypothetical protein